MRTLLYYELKKIFGIRRTLILSGAALLVCLASYWFTCLPTLLHSQFDVQRIRARESALSATASPRKPRLLKKGGTRSSRIPQAM